MLAADPRQEWLDHPGELRSFHQSGDILGRQIQPHVVILLADPSSGILANDRDFGQAWFRRKAPS
jgi:hypothetical protein